MHMINIMTPFFQSDVIIRSDMLKYLLQPLTYYIIYNFIAIFHTHYQ